ncbi:MAG: hypothetical protein F8N37_00135 [Telmatospirillum sp.]|nr:hypothetical protein [Telmatospirillum sp.]
MALRFGKNGVTVDGGAGVEDALTLLEYLQSHPAAGVNLRKCETLHTAVLQVILASGRTVSAWPRDAVLARWLRSVFPGRPSPGDRTEPGRR